MLPGGSSENRVVMAEDFTGDVPQQSVRKAFEALIAGEDAAIDLAQAALLIAKEEYPDLNIAYYMEKLDYLAQQVRGVLGLSDAGTSHQPPQEQVLEAMNRVLFDQEHFHGNTKDYYDPRNSFLNDVLERRTGIPITLAAVYIEIGRRADLEVRGVGFPAHFLARLGEIIFDPFNQGVILSEDDCRARLAEVTSSSMTFQPHYLEPAPTKQIVARMLNNLKHIYLTAHYYRKAIGIMDRLLVVDPKAYAELRDRGAVYAELKQYAQAKADLEVYLQHCGERDRAAVRQALQNIDAVMTLMDD